MSLEDVTDPLYRPDGVDPEASGRTGGHGIEYRYITYVLFDVMHDAIGNNELYESGKYWSDLNEFKVPEIDGIIPMVFLMLQNTTVRELGVGRPAAPGP